MSKVLYEKRDRIAWVTINRPEARNAIDPDVHRLMIETWADFADDDSVDVAVLTGAGEAFCAGADLKTYIPPIIEDATPARIREIVELGLNGLTRGMHRIPKPIVAAVNGWALAGGLETALACDIRIASERAMFGSFEARRGYHHGDGGIVRLVNACGVGVASHMLLTAEPVDARQALEWGLVTKVVPHDELLARGRDGRPPDPAQLPARGPLGQADDPRRDRPAARLPAAHRGLERLHLRRPRGDDGAAAALLRQDRRRARRRARDRALMARRALVTGAARGIGAAIAERLRADGLEVVTADRDEGCDLRFDVAADELPELGEVDVCVSNAAVTDTIAPAHGMTPEQWQRDIDVNLTGAFRVIQACLPGMRERGYGRIVVISSSAAAVGLPGQVAYAASKAGLLGMMKTIAAENVRRGITANAVLPGLIASERVAAMPRELLRDARVDLHALGPHRRDGRGRRAGRLPRAPRTPATSPARRSASTAAPGSTRSR